MLSGSSRSSAECVIPEDQLPAILKAIEKFLKDNEIGEEARILVIHKWHFLLSRMPSVKETKSLKLDQIDLYAIDVEKVLGEGAQGKVVLAQNLSTRQLAAAKIQVPNGPAFYDDLERERRNLRLSKRLLACAMLQPRGVDVFTSSSSSSLSSYSGSYSGSGSNLSSSSYHDKSDELYQKATTYYTLMNYYPGINLLDFLYDYDLSQPKDTPEYFAAKKSHDITSIAKIALFALIEVIELHELGLAHRDIKSNNFVVNTTGLLQDCSALKLIDLGTALFMGKEFFKDDASTLGYMPPEYLVKAKERVNWDAACDCFQLGIVLAELLTCHNYQASLQSFFEKQKQLNDKRHLRFEEIQAFMPDVFAQSSKKKGNQRTKLPSEPNEQSIKEHLTEHLKSLIRTLAPFDRSKRPNLVKLKRLLQELRSELLTAETILNTHFSRERFNAFKLRRKTVVLESSSSTVSTSSSQQVSKVIPPILCPPISDPEELTTRVIFSPRTPLKSLAARGEFAEVYGPEESLVAKLQRTLENLKLLEQQDTSLQAEGNRRSQYVVHSLLVKNLQGIIVEKDPLQQENQISMLKKMVTKYHPTENHSLAQEVESIRSTLS